MLVYEIRGLLTLLEMTSIFEIVWKNYLTEANSIGILYFFKLKHIPVIKLCVLNINTWIAIIKFGGHHALKF